MNKTISVAVLLILMVLAIACGGTVSRTADEPTPLSPSKADATQPTTVQPNQVAPAPTATAESEPVNPPPTAIQASVSVEPSPTPGQVESQPPPAPPSSSAELITEMIARVKPSVVKVVTNLGSGSGMIFEIDESNSSALVLTNYHVIQDANTTDVEVGDATSYSGNLVGWDSQRDLAVLQICCGEEFQAISFGDPSEVAEGTDVIAIGYPLSTLIQGSVTVTRGIVSAIRHDSEVDRWLIQTDAAINPGNSGGPLFTSIGDVIGVNTSKITMEGVEGFGFAISQRTVQNVLPQMKTGGDTNPPSTAKEIPPDRPRIQPPVEPSVQACSELRNCLVYGERRQGEISFRGELDSFVFDGKAGDKLAITGTELFQDPRFALGLAVFDSSLEFLLVAGEAGFNVASISLVTPLPSDGRYTLLVGEVGESTKSSGTGAYTVSIKNLTGPNVIEEKPVATPIPTPIPTATPIPLPDLTVKIVGPPEVDYRTVESQGFVVVNVKYAWVNIGTVKSETSKIPISITLVGFETKFDSTFWDSDPGQYRAREVIFWVNTASACYNATCTVRVEIDPDDLVKESNEANNIVETTLTLVSPPK